MRIIYFVILGLLIFIPSAWAQEEHEGHDDPKAWHDDPIFYMVKAEVDGAKDKDGGLFTWDVDAWTGGDINKLWLHTEGERLNGENKQAELWALYSRNVADYWDLQVGVRQDVDPVSRTYATVGFEGIAPYFFETKAHAFLSNEGDLSARFNQSIELRITQDFIAQPYTELNFSVRDVPDLQVGTGLTNIELGLQLRYEIDRKFAPYVDLNYTQLTGETAHIAHTSGESTDDVTLRGGIRFWF